MTINDVLDWLVQNKEWLFGGIGVAIILGLLKLLFGVERNRPAQKPPTDKPKRATPDHVVFSDKLLGLQPLPGMLDRPLWVINPSPIYFASFPQEGSWVNRGDSLMSFLVKQPLFRNPIFATVKSPVSGRLVYTNRTTPFGSRGKAAAHWLNFLCVIELPKGERIPETMEEAFNSFFDVLWEHRESVLQKPTDGSFTAYSDDVIKEQFSKCREQAPVVISKQEDTYQDRIDYLNLHYPHSIGSSLNIK